MFYFLMFATTDFHSTFFDNENWSYIETLLLNLSSKLSILFLNGIKLYSSHAACLEY